LKGLKSRQAIVNVIEKRIWDGEEGKGLKSGQVMVNVMVNVN
jgi:hypothetical protein